VVSARELALGWIEKNQDRIISVSDRIWEFAEVPLQEVKSCDLLASELERSGFSIVKGVGGMPTAFTATYGKGRPVIGMVGEYDAVPAVSQKPVPRREPLVPGAPGHGCGHNICGTSAAAGAIAVKTAMEAHKLEGTIKFFGCPAEEILVGKVHMAHHGVFNNVDVVLGHHPSFMNTSVLTSESAMNSVKFHFHGKISHASVSPELGISALDAVELMNIGANYLREHMIREGRIHYLIEDGGLAQHVPFPNEVPPYARSWYWIRAPKREQVDKITGRILQIADGTDLIAGTTHDVEFVTGCYDILPNLALAQLYVANMREIGAPKHTDEELTFAREIAKSVPLEEKRDAMKVQRMGAQWERLSDVVMDTSITEPWGLGEFGTGSGDSGNVSYIAPTMKCRTAAYPPGLPHHSWQVTACSKTGIGHKSLIFGSKILACTALDLLTKPEVLAKVRKEFEERSKGKKYVSPLPDGVKLNLNQLPPQGVYPFFYDEET